MKKRMGVWWEKIRTEPWVALLVSLLAALSLIFLTVVICDDPQWIYLRLGIETPIGKKHEALKLLGIGMGGLLLALQALMSYRRATAMEDAANAQAKATAHQAIANQTTEQGQRQERLKNAIEHLGHESDSVRLGGTYELFHLARDTPQLRQTVLDILCAHIRQTTGEPKYRDKHQSKPSEEIQSLLTLLFVRERKVFVGLDINLEGSWLNGSNLGRAHLEEAALERVHLHGAYLWRAQLHGAHLISAELHGADLIGTQLCGANLWRAELHEARFMGTDLRGAFSFLRYPPEPFEASISRQIDWESVLSEAIFAGGLTPEVVGFIGKGLSDGEAKKLRERLAAHIGKPVSHELPENSDVSTGAYTEEEARQWIADYKTATSAVSGIG